MSFREKIDKILKDNKLGVHSVSSLEDFLKAGRGSIGAHIREGTEPGLKTLKKIQEFPGLNLVWWESGKGETFEPKPTSVTKPGTENGDQFYVGIINRLQRLIDDQDAKLEQLTRDLEECKRSRRVTMS